MNTVIVNLFGGPGCGKSTLAAGLFAYLKHEHVNVELVTEYAKDLTWQGHQDVLRKEQLFVFAEQHRRIARLLGKVDVIVTDSPLLLTCVYLDKNHAGYHFFIDLVCAINNSHNCLNYVLIRNRPYAPAGRNQTEDQARSIDQQINIVLGRYGIKNKHVLAGVPETGDVIVNDLTEKGVFI